MAPEHLFSNFNILYSLQRITAKKHLFPYALTNALNNYGCRWLADLVHQRALGR